MSIFLALVETLEAFCQKVRLVLTMSARRGPRARRMEAEEEEPNKRTRSESPSSVCTTGSQWLPDPRFPPPPFPMGQPTLSNLALQPHLMVPRPLWPPMPSEPIVRQPQPSCTISMRPDEQRRTILKERLQPSLAFPIVQQVRFPPRSPQETPSNSPLPITPNGHLPSTPEEDEENQENQPNNV